MKCSSLRETLGLPCCKLQLTSPWRFFSTNYITRSSKIPHSLTPYPKSSLTSAQGLQAGYRRLPGRLSHGSLKYLKRWAGGEGNGHLKIFKQINPFLFSFWGPNFLVLFFILKKWHPCKTTLLHLAHRVFRKRIIKVCIQHFCPLLFPGKMEEVKHFAHSFWLMWRESDSLEITLKPLLYQTKS